MSRVVVVTDSVSCLPHEMVNQYDIRVVPAATFSFNGTTYIDWVDLSPSDALEMLQQWPEGFSTSAIPPTMFSDIFREIGRDAEHVLCLTLSGKLSAVSDMARLAGQEIENEISNVVIRVFDTNTCASAEGLVVLAAARAAQEGRDLDEVMDVAIRAAERTHFVGVFGTTKYLYRSGRIPKVAANMGSTLGIKPLFRVEGGLVRPYSVVRNKKHGIDRCLKHMEEKVRNSPVRVAVAHAGVPDEAEELKSRVLSRFDCVEAFVTEFSPVMAYSIGPGLAAIGFQIEG